MAKGLKMEQKVLLIKLFEEGYSDRKIRLAMGLHRKTIAKYRIEWRQSESQPSHDDSTVMSHPGINELVESVAPELSKCPPTRSQSNRRAAQPHTKHGKAACFPSFRTLDDFDFSFNPSLNKAQVRQLASCGFVAERRNLLLIGPPGVGKTHIAVAIGLGAIHKGFSVIYRSIFDLNGIEPDTVKPLLDAHRLIIDELGMKNLSALAAEGLLEIIHRRHQKSSTIIATNRPVEDWGKMMRDNVTVSVMLQLKMEF